MVYPPGALREHELIDDRNLQTALVESQAHHILTHVELAAQQSLQERDNQIDSLTIQNDNRLRHLSQLQTIMQSEEQRAEQAERLLTDYQERAVQAAAHL